MALQDGGESSVVRRQVWLAVASFSLIIAAFVVLVVVSEAAAEVHSKIPSSSSRKEIESERIDLWDIMDESHSGGHLKNWVIHHGESTWKTLSARVFRIQRADEVQQWPELKLGWRTISAVILGALSAAVCSAAGLGGGALFVPLLNLLLQFDSKTSAAISNFMILGATSVGVALNLKRSHPHEINRPLVDFDIALLMQPNMLLGISIGVILNSVLPNWLITAILTVVLTYMTVHTARNGLKRWDNETHIAKEKRNVKKNLLQRSNTATEKALTDSLLDFYRSLSSRYPVKTFLTLLFVWLTLFAVQILRDGHQGLLKVEECGVAYWILTASQIPVAFGVTAWVIYNLHQTAARSEPGTSESQNQGYVLGPKGSTLFSGMALFAGMVGGMLGVGGAMIVNPLLLSAGVLPQVTAATSLFMVFFSSSMSVAQYWLMGRIPVGFALTAALICAVFSAVGILGLQRIVKKFGRPSLIVFCVATVIGLSAVLMIGFGGLNVWNQFKSGAYMGFSYPC